MTRNIYLLVLSQLLAFSTYSQSSSDEPVNMRQRYDSARRQFERYEKIHGGFVETKNVRMHYLEWGDPGDTPLIWAHGSFTNAYELAGIADDIVAKGYYLVAIDYYGHGLTKIPEHEVSLYHVADDIKALMDFKSIEKAVIGGWSRGGMIATAFYDAYPANVLGLILEDGGLVSTNTHYHKMDQTELEGRVEEIFKDRPTYTKYASEFEAYKGYYDNTEGGTQFTLLAWITMDADGHWVIGPGIEKLFNMSNAQQFVDNILRPTKATLFAQSMSIIEPRIVYRNLKVPMLILDPVSEDDIFPYERENEALKNQHPELIMYKRYLDTGHNIHYERPGKFIEDLGEFLKRICSEPRK